MKSRKQKHNKKAEERMIQMAMDMMLGSLTGSVIRKAIQSGKSVEIVVRDSPASVESQLSRTRVREEAEE